MNKKLVLALSVIILLLVLIVMVSTSTGTGLVGLSNANQSKEKQEVIIGVLVPLTGTGASYGNYVRNGVTLAVSEINSDPKNKYKINLVYQDTTSTATGAVTGINALITSDQNLSAIIGPALSPEVLAVASIAESNKIVLITPVASAHQIKYSGDYIFRNKEDGAIQGQDIAKFAMQKDIDTFAILYLSSNEGIITYKDAFKEEIIKENGTILAEEGYLATAPYDYRTTLLKIKEKNPKGLLVGGTTTDVSNIIKQARELGITSTIFCNAVIEDPKTIEIAGAAAEGVYISTSAFDVTLNNKDIQKFVSNYRTKFNSDPTATSANAYDAMMMIHNIIEQENSTSPDTIKQGLYNTKAYKGIGGLTTFDEYGDVIKPTFVKVVENGKFILYQK